jgi:hypothetical protein
MSPAALSIALFIVQEAIKDAPGLIAALKAIFTTADPTAADWDALRAKVLAKSYADYVPDSALTAAPLQVAAPSATPTAAPQVFTGQAIDPHAG